MIIKLQIFNNINGPDFFFSDDNKYTFNLHIFNLSGPAIQNYRFDIPHPIYYQKTNLSLRECFKDVISIKRRLESCETLQGPEKWRSQFEIITNN